MIQLVIFDMAGTVVDEDNVVYKTLHRALGRGGADLSFEQVLEIGAGREKRDAIQQLLREAGDHLESKVEPVYIDFLDLLHKKYREFAFKPCKGADRVLGELENRGVKRVLNTGYSREIASLILSKLGWIEGQEFDLLVTASDVVRSRPHPDMIDLAMRGMDINDSKMVAKVGDSIIDIEEGKAANVGLTVGVTTGAHTREQLMTASPDYVIDSLDELLILIA